MGNPGLAALTGQRPFCPKTLSAARASKPDQDWNGLPENFIAINTVDAKRLSLETGDEVRIIGPTFSEPIKLADGNTFDTVGKIKVMEGIRPGVVAASWSYGHYAYGSNDIVVDGETIKGDARRKTGVVPNPAMRLDPVVGDVCLTDPIGGSASFYDTLVTLKKV